MHSIINTVIIRHPLKILTQAIPKGIPEEIFRRPGLSLSDGLDSNGMKNWLVRQKTKSLFTLQES